MTNLCTHCRQVPAVPGISLCYECAEDASAEIAAANQPRYTGEACVWCGALLTDHDDCSTHPNYCASCRAAAHQDYQNFFAVLSQGKADGGHAFCPNAIIRNPITA